MAAAEVCQILLKSTVLSLRQPAKVHYLFVSFLPVQGEDIFPIPGTKRLNYLEENVAAFNIKLTAEDKQQLEAVFAADQVTSCMLQHIRHTPPVVKCHSWIFCAVVSKSKEETLRVLPIPSRKTCGRLSVLPAAAFVLSMYTALPLSVLYVSVHAAVQWDAC